METGRVVFLSVRAIRPNPAQPRQVFDQNGLQELAASIVQHGILQPLSVRRVGNIYELIAGERRLRAAKLAGLEEVPCLLMSMDENQSGLAALVENLQRRDLDFIEEAQGLARLMQLGGLSQEQAAQKVGKSQSAVANKLRLLRHSPQVLDALRSAGLTERHARALLKLNKDEDKLAAIGLIAQRGLTVAQTEQYVQDMLSDRVPGTRRRRPPDIREFLNDLTQSLALIQSAGVAAVSRQQETDREITLTITIPKCAG
ncbi:MAG TPA: ParB/RepB/Spo0J family partition protein [Candidatus Faecousia faecigallinarum]|nr:ParB/RepB/Spo0J family partition protein [Candidatus Faecousia faecigallinarum]